MGRIKSSLIKRTANKLVHLHRDQFKEDFQYNKTKVEDLAKINSYRLRNSIAGLVTKLVKKKQ